MPHPFFHHTEMLSVLASRNLKAAFWSTPRQSAQGITRPRLAEPGNEWGLWSGYTDLFMGWPCDRTLGTAGLTPARLTKFQFCCLVSEGGLGIWVESTSTWLWKGAARS